MRSLRQAWVLSLGLSGLFLSSCGGGNRVLESISISPNPAVAKGGTAQLVATGTFSSAPVTVSPLTVDWSQSPCNDLCNTEGSNVITPISVNSAGLVNCNGFQGTVPVKAVAPKNPSLPAGTTGVPTVQATVNLTCK